MKKMTILFFVLSAGFIFLNFTIDKANDNQIPEPLMPGVEMSENVKTIIDNSCYGCHNADSKNEKGKKKLDFDKIGSDYNAIKSAGKLKDIAKVVSDGDMPPEKYLEHYPEKALNDEQKKSLGDWATQQAATVSGK